jgi:hypothetical protein
VFATSHVLAGATIGALCRRRPVHALALGAASHVAMDMAPHWGRRLSRDDFYVVARRDGLLAAGVLVAAVAAARSMRASVAAGALGAVLLDADKPCKHFFGCSCFPRRVDQFHAAIQNEAPDRLGLEVVSGIVLAAVTALALRKGRTAAARASSRPPPRHRRR